MFMDKLKLCRKTERERARNLEWTNAMVMEWGKTKHTNGINLPDGDLTKNIETSG